MHFNENVPHSSNDIGIALKDFPCQDTADGSLRFEQMILGMTKDYGSHDAYR
jgi:hypothetical protein